LSNIIKKKADGDILKMFNLSNVMDFLQIRFRHLKLTSAAPGLSNTPKLQFKSNITGIFVTDMYRIVGAITGFKADRKPVVHSRYQSIR
jgi:hypothetical protein